MIFEPFAPFAASDFLIKSATDPWEKRAAAALREQVFCHEQELFDGNDRDAIDEVAITLVAVSMVGFGADEVLGTVRIHEAEPGVWWGSRLAVAAEYRRVGALGAGLIRLAVSCAHARGCTKFLANVQSQNALLFSRMHWDALSQINIHGKPHHHMQADLAFYPPIDAPETGFHTLRRAA